MKARPPQPGPPRPGCRATSPAIARAGIELDPLAAAVRRARRGRSRGGVARAADGRRCGAPGGDALRPVRGCSSAVRSARSTCSSTRCGRAQPSLTLYPAGALRRFEPTVGDLAGPRRRRRSAIRRGRLGGQPPCRRRPVAQPRRRHVRLGRRGNHPARRRRRPALGAALLHYTGSREHVSQLAGARPRARPAPDAGRPRRRRRPCPARPPRKPTSTPRSICRSFPPELRHGLDDVEARRTGTSCRGSSPLDDIHGDLHCHTLWSDGRDSTERRGLGGAGARLQIRGDHRPLAHRRRLARQLSLDRPPRQQAAGDRGAPSEVPGDH